MATEATFLDKFIGLMKKVANKISTDFSLSPSTDGTKPKTLETNTVELSAEQKKAQNTPSTLAYDPQKTNRTITPGYDTKLSKEKRFIQNIRDIMVDPRSPGKKKKPKK